MQSQRFLLVFLYALGIAVAQTSLPQSLCYETSLIGAAIAVLPQGDGSEENSSDKQEPLEPHRKGGFQVTRRNLPASIYSRAEFCFGGNLTPVTGTSVRGKSDIVYEVRVGKDYTPEKPAGVFVFISPTDKGRPPKRYDSVLAERNIIYIGANQSGNEVDPAWRVAMAAYAVSVLGEAYNLDHDRIYIAGMSGGGRAASHGMLGFQDVFSGALLMVGANAMLSDEKRKL